MKNSIHQAFEQAIEENKRTIYRICKVYAVSPIEPEDLFQEVTLHIWEAFSNFEGRAKLSTWIYRIALNVCMRSKKKSENSKMIQINSIEFKIPAVAPDLSMQEKFNALYGCIRSLNQKDQSITILVLDELPYKDIAEITGLSENHIAVKMKRIKKVLLNCINKKLK